jgi:RecB family exonuclease
MPLPRGYISHSQIRAYTDCPRKYFYAYIEDIQPPVNEKLFLGEVFHSVIERYFLLKIGGERPEDGAMAGLFAAAFDEAEAGRKVCWQAPRRETKERGLAFLKHFLEHIAPRIRPLMVEKELTAELPGSGVVLKGVIDLVEEDYCITDFKTTTGKWPESKASNAPQMVIYKYLFDRCFGPVHSTLKYEVLYGKNAGNVRHQTLHVVPAAGAVDSLLAMIGHVVERIEDGAFQPNVTGFCRYCEFRSLCREKGAG